MPNKAILRHSIFKLWRDYFGFEVVYEDRDLLMKTLADEELKLLLAQMPHAVMVIICSDSTSFVGLNHREVQQ